jgi:RNA polymerase sigma-70 factor (ECF subfamily)
VSEDTGRRVADIVRRARDRRAPTHVQHAAFATLVERFEAMAFATALRACDDIEAARDACQEAFLVAWRMLPALREPEAFGGWLKRLVRTQNSRVRRRRRVPAGACDEGGTGAAVRDTAEVVIDREVRGLLRRAVESLPAVEREAVIRFYLLGETLRVIAGALGVTTAVAGKRLYTGRLHLRRALPRTVAREFLGAEPTPAFTRRVMDGVFDEFVGEYRFASRPDHRVFVRREGHVLASYAGGQRNVLSSRAADRLVATEFDGEARFRRNRRGEIGGFVYYEFGRRLGVAQKLAIRS